MLSLSLLYIGISLKKYIYIHIYSTLTDIRLMELYALLIKPSELVVAHLFLNLFTAVLINQV